MQNEFLPLLIFLALATGLPVVIIGLGRLIGPRRQTAVKQMPYESGMDPIHDTHRRFDVRFHLVAIAFLVFDVELLFLYPWAVAARRSADPAAPPPGIDAAVADHWVSSRDLVFLGVMFFMAVLIAGFVYDWRKGLFRWR